VKSMSPVVSTDWLREVCLSFPGATEQIQWGYDLLFKVGGKMFAVTPLEPARVFLSFKASPDNFAELTERALIIPAPYLARAQWVALEGKEALPAGELAGLLRESYELVAAKLPKKVRAGLAKSSERRKPGGKAKNREAGRKEQNTRKAALKKRTEQSYRRP
jgi:predicted DNA-binding protein (MmcQ/YjbR family)